MSKNILKLPARLRKCLNDCIAGYHWRKKRGKSQDVIQYVASCGLLHTIGTHKWRDGSKAFSLGHEVRSGVDDYKGITAMSKVNSA